jgi:hypothetical protein
MYCGRPLESMVVIQRSRGSREVEYRTAGFDARFAPDMAQHATSEERGRRRKGWPWGLSLILLLASLAGAERIVRWAVTRTSLPTGQAEWIWAPIDEGQAEPQTFYLVRDFHLDVGIKRARLLCLADEEYVAIVNGTQVGGGRFVGKGILDEYAVGRFLKRGRNRLVIEARSSRGNGGLLLSLEVQGPEESKTVVSDGSWQVFRHQERGLGRARDEIPEGEAPVVWGLPPMGRWPLPTMVRRRPTIPELLIGGEPRRPTAVRQGGGKANWRPIDPDAATLNEGLGPWVTFDWGKPVTGYLALEYPIEQSPLALVYLGEDLPDPTVSRPTATLAGLEGGWLWSDALPRRFRYATVLVREGTVTGAMVYLTNPRRSAELIPADERSSGVFGLRSENLRTPLEDEFRRELHGLARPASGEDL